MKRREAKAVSTKFACKNGGSLFPVSHHEKFGTGNAVFSLAQKYLIKKYYRLVQKYRPYFLVQTFVKKDGSFVCKHRWTENQKSLYEAIGKEPLQQNHWKVMSLFLVFSLFRYEKFVRIQTIHFLFGTFLSYPQSWTEGWRQIHKIMQNRFFYGIFHSWYFPIFYQKT